MTAWILVVVMARGERAQVMSAHHTDVACMEAGVRWQREAEALARKMKRPRPPGWICTTTEETPS